MKQKCCIVFNRERGKRGQNPVETERYFDEAKALFESEAIIKRALESRSSNQIPRAGGGINRSSQTQRGLIVSDLARFFVQIGNADTLGSGMRNLMKYTKLYSGGEPELFEGEIFRSVIPLGTNVSVSATDKLPAV